MSFESLDVQEYLRTRNYLVELKVHSKGCTAHFPERLMSPITPARIRDYSLRYGKGNRAKLNIMDVSREVSATLDLPAYAARLLIYGDVICLCENLHYDLSLIVVESSDVKLTGAETDFLSMLPGPKSEEQKEKERNLQDVFIQAYPTNFAPFYSELANVYQVEEGYNTLAELLSGEN